MYWTLELASKLEDAPWPASKDELIDYAIRSGAPMEVIENLQDIEDDEERKLLSNFAFICSLSFDIWVKKSVIESIIDKDMMDQKKSNSKKKN